MSYRQILINCECHLKFKDNQLVVVRNNIETQIAIEDIYIVVIENDSVTFTSVLIHELSKRNIVVLFCGSNHMPICMTLPQGQHYRPYDVFLMQQNQSQVQKNFVSETLLKSKIKNQLKVLEICNKNKESIQKMHRYYDEIVGIDELNREGTAAKVYFNALFGIDFKRFENDDINATLNYGYGVLRSAVARSLSTYGFTLYIGVHHVGKENPLNLVYDIIEPFRPVVDYYIAKNFNVYDKLLSVPIRKEIVHLLNAKVKVNEKEFTVQNAIDLLVKSYLRFLENGIMELDCPEILEIDFDRLYEFI